jgi:integrase
MGQWEGSEPMAKKMNTPQPDGRYRVRVYIGIKDGKKVYKSVYGRTQKEADIKAEELKVSLRKGMDISSSNDSFKTWAEYWLISKKHEVSVDRYNTLESRAKVWKDNLYNAQISQIKPFELQTILFSISAKNPYTDKPMAKKTIRGYVQVINAIFDFAIDNRVIDYNPANKLKAPQTATSVQRRALTEIERQWVMEFEHRAQPSAMLMMLSGLRRGEATALQWNDIDFVNNKISVTKSYNFKQKEFKTPKNGKARVVTVPQVLIDYLKTLPKVSLFVLTNAKGRMMTDDSWRRLYQSYMMDLNIKYGFGGIENAPSKFAPTKMPMLITPFTPHELRHTFCTIMYEAGIDALAAKEQLGHSDIKTTLSIYTHLSSQHKENDLKKLDVFLKGGSEVAQQIV